MEKVFENFTVAIMKLDKLVKRIKMLEMKKYGLKSVHAMCIYYLGEHPSGLTAGELVRLTLEDKAAISRAVKELSECGLVTCSQCGYNAPITLTERGREMASEFFALAEGAVREVGADFTEEERAAFYRSLGDITENLENYYAKLVGAAE